MDTPIRLTNLGSHQAHRLAFTREALWERMDPEMGRKAVRVPVYLVNPAQMDLLYPPERLRFLDPEGVSNWAREQRRRGREEERQEEEESPLSGLEEMGEVGYRRYREVVAVGLYLGEPPADALWQRLLSLGSAPSPAKPEGPAIFLCPERILDWGERAGVNPQLVLDKVYYHELAHALMDTGPTPYDELWGRTVEESLANWVAVGRFRGTEARLVQRLIQDQPAEYQGYAHLGAAIRAHPGMVEALRSLPFWHFWEVWVERWEWAMRRAGLPRKAWVWLPLAPSAVEEDDWASPWVYQAWGEAKRSRMDPGFWATYAHHLLLEVFACGGVGLEA